jgi:AraC-like DNA-binding protein
MKLDQPWQKPLLDDFLRRIRLRTCVCFRSEFRSPWGIRIARRCAIFHIVKRGSCCLQVGEGTETTRLSEGDVVVVTRGDAHTLRSRPSTKTVNFFDLVKSRAADGLTHLLCVGAYFETGVSNPLAAMLPPVLLLQRKEQGPDVSLAFTTQQISTELDSGEAASGEVVTRLMDILFIRAVGAYFDSSVGAAENGWLAGFRDERIGRALAEMHAHPEKPWTIDTLARTVALSRSAFAAKFRELLGEPPLHYLARLRINTAAIRLRLTDEKLKSVASAAGYESLAAFIKSFKRIMGLTPGEYRELR